MISMINISLQLPDDLLKISGECAQFLSLSRAEYIRQAIRRMNQATRAQLRARRLALASKKVRGESMRINAEFEAIDFELNA